MKWILLIISLTNTSRLCLAQPLSLTDPQKLATLEAFQRVQNGIAPSANQSDKKQIFARVESDLLQTQHDLSAQPAQTLEKCEKFVAVANQVVNDLQSAVRTLTLRQNYFNLASLSDYDFELANHTRISAAALSELALLVKQNAEGGYSVLDSRNKTACPLTDRDNLAANLDSTIEDLSQLFEAVFGVPGVIEMEKTQQRLIRLAIADERVDRQKFWGTMAALTVASVVFWEFGPEIAAGSIRLLWGQTPKIFAIPAFLYGIKVSALVAEGVAFTYADRWTSSRVSPPKIFIGSWDEHINSIQTFVKSPIHVPELELAFLSRIHALMLMESLQWFAPVEPILKDEEQRWGSIEKAIEHYKAQRWDVSNER